MNCNSCKEYLYELEGKEGECINEEDKPENYYKSSNMFKIKCLLWAFKFFFYIFI